MFDPIYSFTGDSFGQFVLIIHILSLVLIFGNYFIGNAIQFVRDEKWKPLLLESQFGEDRDIQWMFMSVYTFIGWVITCMVVAILNWLWFPCVVITGIIAMLYVARGVVRLKRNLEEHKADNTLHNPPKSR